MDRDANNQMFPIAWDVVGVENNQNWCWFLSLLRDDLNLGDGGGISTISDGHKGLIQAVADWLPNAEHRRATFKNEISECFDSRILGARGKPIITMSEDIMVYLIQRMWCMNKLAFDNKDSITPSVIRQMEFNKKIQRPAKSSAFSSRGGSSKKGGSRGGVSKRGRGSSKRGRCSNTMPLQGLRDESDEDHQFKMDMEALYEMKSKQIANEEFDHLEEPNDDKGMPKDVSAGKQPMIEDVSIGKQPMIEDDSLQVGADLPT
ncbi:calcium/proton exchanger [Tanacetum coccineum]